MKIWKQSVLFYVGGMSYVALELLWRKRSHSSMFVLGGACFLALGKAGREISRLHPILRPFAGAAIITASELAAGLLVNRRHRIWDYTGLPCNFLGQICLPYTILWVPVSAAAMALHRRLSLALDHSTFR